MDLKRGNDHLNQNQKYNKRLIFSIAILLSIVIIGGGALFYFYSIKFKKVTFQHQNKERILVTSPTWSTIKKKISSFFLKDN